MCSDVALVFLFPVQFLLNNKLSGVRRVSLLEHNFAPPEQERKRETGCGDEGSSRGPGETEEKHFGCPIHQLAVSVPIPSHAEH